MAIEQPLGIRRTDLQLSIPGREVIQTRVEFDPGYVSPSHTHFGEELVYVLEGMLEYQVEGEPTRTYWAGEALTVPTGVAHLVRNVGGTIGASLSTYVVEVGKPLITLVD